MIENVFEYIHSAHSLSLWFFSESQGLKSIHQHSLSHVNVKMHTVRTRLTRLKLTEKL